jgi:hypothetical protein
MPHPSSASPPTTQSPSPPPAADRRGNPGLHLAPRCGARTRAGCPCRAPAIRGKLRCRMHGGRSTGPRTEAGRARLRAAHTTHGHSGADARALSRHHVTFIRRANLRMFAMVHLDRLPPGLAARMDPMAPELECPPRPTRGISRAEDRAMLQAEAAALAPWKQAMAQVRQARRAARAARAAARGAKSAALARPHAPIQAAAAAGPASARAPSARAAGLPTPHAPIPPAPAKSGPQLTRAGARVGALAKTQATDCASRGVRPFPASAKLAAPPKPHAPIPAAPARRVSAPAPASARAMPLARPLATERAPHGERHAPAPARLPALPKPYAPIPAAPARPVSEPPPAGARAMALARPHATDRVRHGERHAPAPARLSAQPKPHAPIPAAPARPVSEPPPASAPAEHVARPHAPGRTPHGMNDTPAVPIAPHAPTPHAPVAPAAARSRTDTAAIRRAAAQWRAEQRRWGRA